ncbi:hypothetical protein [Nonomuraea sp. NPDC001699]
MSESTHDPGRPDPDDPVPDTSSLHEETPEPPRPPDGFEPV